MFRKSEKNQNHVLNLFLNVKNVKYKRVCEPNSRTKLPVNFKAATVILAKMSIRRVSCSGTDVNDVDWEEHFATFKPTPKLPTYMRSYKECNSYSDMFGEFCREKDLLVEPIQIKNELVEAPNKPCLGVEQDEQDLQKMLHMFSYNH